MIGAITAGFLSFKPTKPVLSGGTLTSDATYYYRTFLSSSNLVVTNTGISVDALVIGAGGAGGPNGRGGGAGGELFYSTGVNLSTSSYTCTIGAGAAWTTNGGRNGSSSVFSGSGITTITATAGQDGLDPSGGAGRNNGASGGSYATTGVAGGTGVSTYSSFGSVTSTGENVSGTYYYVGGGGGGANNSTNSAGGSGGGGRGGSFQGINPLPALAGSANTGGGGGGMGNGEVLTNSQGGSGLIIIRYLKSLVD